MRRLPAILFIAILVFNFYGYRLMIGYMQYRHTVALDSRLDNDQYHEADLISIKTPLNLPYYSSSPDYERAYGSVEVNGITYQYVKRRVHQDTLELLCLPNKAKTQLQSVKNEYCRLFLDGTASQSEKHPVPLKISLPDFFQEMHVFALSALSELPARYDCSNTFFAQANYSAEEEHPPQSMPSIG